MSISYNTEQQIFCLNLLSNILFFLKNPSEELSLQDTVNQGIKAVFSDSRVKKLIGEWEVVWGAVVSDLAGDQTDRKNPDNVIYMAKSQGNSYPNDYPGNKESDRYVIAIAGTNPSSLHDILIEDLWVNTTRLWYDGKPWDSDFTDQTSPGKRISAGVTTGLHNLENMKFHEKSLLSYLKEITSNSKPISISICGHSLGGALSPIFALSLMDRKSEWDSQNNATLEYISPVAGFTPGNEEFAEYYDSQLGKVTNRIWNDLDFVPHEWEKDMLEQARTFYHEGILDKSKISLINLFIDFYQKLSKNTNYKHICSQQPAFKSKYQSNNINIEETYKGLTYAFLGKLPELILHNLGIDNAYSWLGDSLPGILNQLTKELDKLDKSLSSEEIDNIIRRIIDKSPIANKKIDKLINYIAQLYSTWPDLKKYGAQMNYQHVNAYIEHLQIDDFFMLMASIPNQQLKPTGGKN